MGNCNVLRAGAACSIWHHEPRCCRRAGGGVEAGVRAHVVELGLWLGCKSQLSVATPSNITLPPCVNKTRKLSHAFIPHPPPPGQSHPPCLQQPVHRLQMQQEQRSQMCVTWACSCVSENVPRCLRCTACQGLSQTGANWANIRASRGSLAVGLQLWPFDVGVWTHLHP